MTREEAIRILASSCIPGSKQTEALETLIPELAESEDERIRKELKEAFEAYDIESMWNGIPIRSIFAWLEKQKEQKPWKVGANAYFTPEQKPADLSDMMVHKEPYIAPVPTPMVADEQKQAEWSDTDNIGWDEAFACVTRAEKSAKNEEELQNAVTAEKWLKEIKFKYYVHPIKQEWSEEDDLNCNRIIRFLEPHKTFFPTKETKEEMQNWIKTRLKSLRPSWKPSENELGRKHLDGYIMGMEDAMREMKDFIESHFNTNKAEG